MYIDRNLVLTGVTAGTNGYTIMPGQAVTASAATTDAIDQNAMGAAVEQLFALVQVGEAATAAGAATVRFSIQSADDSSFSTNLTTHIQSDDIGKAALTLNSTAWFADLSGIKFRRYIRGYFTVGTGPLTAGRFTFCFVPHLTIQ